MPIAALTADLFFTAKIAAAARHLAIEVQFARDVAALRAFAADASGVIVDLDAAEGAAEVVAALKQEWPGKPVVAFVSHVRTEAIIAARAAGADHVLVRSRFTDLLGNVLSALAAGVSLRAVPGSPADEAGAD